MKTTKTPTLLGGDWVGPADDDWYEDVDPADTRNVVALVPRLSAWQITESLDKASKASEGWIDMSPIDRGRILLEAARLIRDRADSIADDICREAGKLLTEARGEVLKSADFLEYYAGFGRMAQGEVLPDERAGTFTYTLREPLGLVALITAWNDPMLTPARKIAPALVAGNSVVIKPAEDTPLAALHLSRALVDAGLPSTALNVVVGYPEDVGAAVVDHPSIRALSFTGSTATSRVLKSRLSDRNVRFQAETGGKNAVAVLADADVDVAARTIVSAAYAQAGQRCTATSRVVADTAIADEVTDAIITHASALAVGPGYDPDSQMGPVINDVRRQAISQLVKAGTDFGDRLVYGGGNPGGSLEHGYFVEPTVVEVEDRASPLWREEVFGPVVAITRVDDLSEAVDAVNDSTYGLSAGVFTRDLTSAMEFARSVETGQVAVNRPTSGWDVHLPFGGFKESGSVSKEQGTEGVEFYTKLKTVAVGHDG